MLHVRAVANIVPSVNAHHNIIVPGFRANALILKWKAS